PEPDPASVGRATAAASCLRARGPTATFLVAARIRGLLWRIRTMSSRRVAMAGVAGPLVIAFALLATGGGSPPNFGDPLPGLTDDEQARFQTGKDAFEEVEDVADGLGPVFNDNACVKCHSV